MIQLRPGVPEDCEWMLGQLREFDMFIGAKRSLFPDVATATTQMLSLIAEHVVILAYSDVVEPPEPVGFIIGLVGPHYFNPQLTVLTELMWWVDPEWRRSRAGLMLLNTFIAVGKEHADWIIVTLEEKSPVNPTTLEKRGFNLWERSYILEV